MGAYDRFKNAEPMGVRNYITPGKHRLLVKRSNMSPSTHPNRPNQEKAVVEFKVIRSEQLMDKDGNPATDKAGKPFPAMKVGESCSLVETSAQQGYFGNVLAFTAGILGYGIEEMKNDPDFDNVFIGCWGPDQLMTGMLVDCVAQQVDTTSASAKSDVYTAKTWEAVHASEYANHALEAPDGAFGQADDGDGDGEAAA